MNGNTKLFVGIIVGVVSVWSAKRTVGHYKRFKEGRPNYWERTFAEAEFITYKPRWGSELQESKVDAFTRIHLEKSLAPMRVYKTYTPMGLRALLVVSKYADVVAVYETELNSKVYSAMGHPSFMERTIEGVDVFTTTVPKSNLIDVCDPASALYERDEFSPYFNLDPNELSAALEIDRSTIELIENIADAVADENFAVRKFLENDLPNLVEYSFKHLTLRIDLTEDDPVDVRVGERQEARRVNEIIQRNLEAQIDQAELSASNDLPEVPDVDTQA